MMKYQQVEGRPDVCPKGHPIWWFSHSDGWGRSKERARWWGVCRGKPVAGRLDVSGPCRLTWFWSGGEIAVIDGLSSERLMRTVRNLANQLGMFTDPQEPMTE